MKNLTLPLLFTVLAVVFAVPVFAGPQESVEITVNPTQVSISLSPASLDFGSLGLDQESAHGTAVDIENTGTVAVDLDMKGSDAECTTPSANVWTLSDSDNGVDTYMLMVSKDSSFGDADDMYLTTSYAAFLSALGTSTNQTFRARITMPSHTSVYGEHTARIYVQATEH